MKYLIMMIVATVAISCAHKHDGAKTECTDCAKHDSADKAHECTSCDAHKNGHGSVTTPEAPTFMLAGDMVTQKISQEEFATLYTKNKEKLGKKCTTPAATYCGKTTKDMMVSETEASCLWTKVFRSTRESLPGLDGSSCAKMYKGFVKK